VTVEVSHLAAATGTHPASLRRLLRALAAFSVFAEDGGALARYVEGGRLSIDNNLSERLLRGIAVTRKNFLFVGSDEGGQRAAIIHTIAETAKLNGLDGNWLRPALECVQAHYGARHGRRKARALCRHGAADLPAIEELVDPRLSARAIQAAAIFLGWTKRSVPRPSRDHYGPGALSPRDWPLPRRLRHWRRLTILGAIAHDGMVAAMTVAAATSSAVFIAFVEQVLTPALQTRPGATLVMDNLAPHKAASARAGLARRYLPPYSPDLNPIELAWSKLKEGLRQVGPRTIEALDAAVSDAFAKITAGVSVAATAGVELR
jgi:transposase